jgi:hypothetical protein
LAESPSKSTNFPSNAEEEECAQWGPAWEQK